MTANLTDQQLTSFVEKFGQPHYDLAYHAAFPMALTPDLLYRLWAHFRSDIHGQPLNIPWVAVADVLLAPFCDEVGFDLYEIEASLRGVLLDRLKADPRFGPRRLQELADFLLSYHQITQLHSDDPDLRDLAQAQRWMAQAQTQSPQLVQELAHNLVTVSGTDGGEWGRMAALLEQLPLLEGDGKALQHYAHAMATLAQGDPQTALSYFRKLSGVKRDRVEIAGVSLVVPEELRPQLQQLPHMPRRRWLQWAGWGAAGFAGAILINRALLQQSTVSDEATDQPLPLITSIDAVVLNEENALLKQEIANLETLVPGLTPHIFWVDLNSRDYVDYGGSEVVASSATIAVPILAAFLKTVDANALRLNQTVILQDSFIAGGSGTMQSEPVGTEYEAIDVASRMVTESDNTATNLIINLLGGRDNLNQTFREWGLVSTVLRSPLPDLEGTNTTSARDLSLLLALIADGHLLSTDSRLRMFEIMVRTVNKSLIAFSVNEAASVANKTGDIGSVLGDMALIRSTESQYALTVLVERPLNDGRASELIRRAADLVETTIVASPVEGLQSQDVMFPIEVVTVNPQGEEVERQQNQVNGVRWSQGDEFTLEMVDIPAGEFEMGAPETEEGWNSAESPQHVVRVDAFSMGRYPITQAQWRFVAGLPRIDRNLEPDPSSFTGDNRPVERVSWYEAVEFCDRLSEFLGTPCRLPSEAEWEYACRASQIQTSGTPGIGEVRRAGTTTPFHFGETITTDLANYQGTDWEYQGKTYPGNYGQGPHGSFREQTTKVGIFPANAFGLYDMHGNVWEWCQDVWHSNYAGAPTDGSAWVEGGDDSVRLMRGGSWLVNPQFCRSANRGSRFPDVLNSYTFGFRIVSGSARAL